MEKRGKEWNRFLYGCVTTFCVSMWGPLDCNGRRRDAGVSFCNFTGSAAGSFETVGANGFSDLTSMMMLACLQWGPHWPLVFRVAVPKTAQLCSFWTVGCFEIDGRDLMVFFLSVHMRSC